LVGETLLCPARPQRQYRLPLRAGNAKFCGPGRGENPLRHPHLTARIPRMSGPKLIELRRMRAALERQRNHDRCAAFGSEYARLLQEFHDWERRLSQLAVPAEDTVRPLEPIRAEIDHLLRQEAHHEAARIFGEGVSRLRAVVEKGRHRFEE